MEDGIKDEFLQLLNMKHIDFFHFDSPFWGV
jgi:hypothetical protein